MIFFFDGLQLKTTELFLANAQSIMLHHIFLKGPMILNIAYIKMQV